MTTDVVVHENPVWRDRANFIIAASITGPRSSTRWRWEQLWAKQIGENHFEVCCIPFFIYDLALGDEVETGTKEGKKHVVTKVLNRSARFVFRVWFSDVTAREMLLEEIKDRKSTRLNSSHDQISYAVFC